MATITSDNLKGSVVVVTGATNGIGLGLVEKLATVGVKGLVISSRTQANIDKVVKDLEAKASEGTSIKGKAADARKWEDMVALMEYTNTTFGHVDYVVVNGGSLDLQPVVFDKLEKPDLHQIVESLDNVFNTIHAATPFLAKSPRSDRAVLLTGSEAAFNGFDLVPYYAIAKSALHGLVYSYVDLLRPHNIRINIVSMNYVLTGMTDLQHQAGGFRPSDFVPMEVVVGCYIDLANDSSKTGVIRRIPNPRAIPFDIQAETMLLVKTSYWAPFLAKLAEGQA